MTTINSVGNGLSGATGTGNFVGANSPTLVTPTLGAASATSMTFSSTSGVIGTTTNNNAAALSVGEFVSSVISSASPVSFSNGVSKDLTSISLTAGDWDVWGNLTFVGSVSNIAGLAMWVSSTSATTPDSSLYSNLSGTGLTYSSTGLPVPQQRFSLSTTTTIYISGFVNFAAGTVTGNGAIYARRRR